MILADLFSNYADVRKEMFDAVKNLTREQLDWKPDTHPNSIGYLLTHIVDAEYFWIDCVACRRAEYKEPSYYETLREPTDILAALNTTFDSTMAFLRENEVEDWDEVRFEFTDARGQTHRFTKRWLTWHVVEHQARHRGQIFMLLRMQGLEVPHV